MSESSKHAKVVNVGEQVNNKRRDALKKLGKYSAYTAPALLALLTPKQGRAGGMSMVP